MKVTIVDIAKKAGVSRTTVSNALNGNNAKCSKETREKIIKIASELGYQPNLAAKTLVTNKSNLIGVFFPSYVDDKAIIDSYFYSNVVKGIEIGVIKKDPNKDLIMKFLSSKYGTDELINWIRKRNLEGLICIGELNDDLLKKLNQINLPIVLIDNYSNVLENAYYVNTNDELGGYIATKKLINDGYEKVAYITSAMDCTGVNYRRYLGYQKALNEFNKKEYVLEEKELSFDIGLNITNKIIQNKIDGIFCSSDEIALGIIKGLYNKGIKIPEQKGIVGFDNISFSSQSVLTLTTVDQDILNKGIKSINLLIDTINKCNKTQDSHIVLPVKLINRQSTRNI